MRTRIMAIIFALVLVLTPLSALGEGDEGFEDQYRIGTDDQIFIDPEEVDPGEQLRLNGYYYRPDMSTAQRLIVKTGDLVTAFRLAATASEFQQQGIDADNLFIRNGKAFIDVERTPDLTPAERTQQLIDVRTILNEADVNAMDLSGKEFTLEDGSGHARSILIQSVWQSPLDPPGYDPLSKALPPTLQSMPAPMDPIPEPEDPMPESAGPVSAP